MRRTIHFLLLVSLISTSGWSANPIGSLRPNNLTLEVQQAIASLAPHEQLSVIVHLNDHAVQTAIIHWLQQHSIADIQPFWIFNGLAITAPRGVILDLAQRPEVERISLDAVITADDDPAVMPVAADYLAAIGVPSAWARGFTGKGIVVAVLDSGVDMTHPQLAARWRGGDNSWFDPNGEHDTPFDFDGHGTQVLSVILGGEVDGQAIGVAPDAQWIAAKIFNDRNRATIAGIHQALQWVLDPDGDPATADAPQVVNSSWSFVNGRCDLEFADDLQALRDAGILPVFAAGIRDSVSPANTPQAFAVGAIAQDGSLLSDSPHGPSVCDETHNFPQIVAPGADIHTIDRFGFNAIQHGTSLAAAHVSGALALLLSADPRLSADEQAAILIETADDLGAPGVDQAFGYGRINIAAALDRVLGVTSVVNQEPNAPTYSAAAIVGLVVLSMIGLLILRKRSL
jgi:subtilisin family serine protease